MILEVFSTPSNFVFSKYNVDYEIKQNLCSHLSQKMLVDDSICQQMLVRCQQTKVFSKERCELSVKPVYFLRHWLFFFFSLYRMLHAIAEKKDVRLYIRYEELLQENTGEILFVWLIFKKFYPSTCSPFTTAFCQKKKVNLPSNHPVLLHALIALIGIREATWIPWKMCPGWCRQTVELLNIKIFSVWFCFHVDMIFQLFCMVLFVVQLWMQRSVGKIRQICCFSIVQNMTEHS